MKTTHTQLLSLFSQEDPLLLDCGVNLSPVDVAFETWGKLNAARDNAILVCHALTGSAHAAGRSGDGSAGWWEPMIGPGRALDTDQYVVICANILGSCYGTTGPNSTNPWTGVPYGASFPVCTVRDMVRVQKRLLDSLGIRRLACVIGSSLGGMQALEWTVLYPEFCETSIPISVAARQPAWCIGWNSAARAAIRLDPVAGLAAARMIGMISYRSPVEFEERFGRRRKHGALSFYDPQNVFEIESYLAYQGSKLVDRFDAQTYIALTRAMDLHDVGHGRGGIERALAGVQARTLSIGVSSDIRYPTGHQKELAQLIPGACYAEIESVHGHDAFLIEYGQLTDLVGLFLNEVRGAAYQKVSGWR